MDSLPPNDPNRNNNNNNNNTGSGRQAPKEQPHDGSRRNSGGNNGQQDGQPMNIIGDLDEAPAVVMMFLVGMAAWFLREQCVC